MRESFGVVQGLSGLEPPLDQLSLGLQRLRCLYGRMRG